MGKVVLITGASSGIGKATAKLLIDTGYTVYAAARRTERMNDLKELGAKVLHMDVTDGVLMENAVKEIVANENRIDILINNAGFGLLGAIEDVSIDAAKHQMEVNLFGLARLTQLVLPYMRVQEFGKIVNVTSTSGKMAAPLSGWYSASKFAVEGLSDSLRMEVKQFGIDVIVIEPGGVKSEWNAISTQSIKPGAVGKAYENMAQKIIELAEKFDRKNADPKVIAELILKSITAQQPKTRYHAGYMAGIILFLKKVLTDRQFDKLALSQLK
jgi:short-subunit dehydrogenase